MTFQVEAPFLMWELFWKGLSFGQRVVHTISVNTKGLCIPFLSARKGYSSKGCPQDMGSFFLVNKRIWQTWSYSKSWCIPNHQILDPTKNSFFVTWFLKNLRKKFLNQGFFCSLPRQHDQRFIWFPKIVPLRAPRPFIQIVQKWKKVFYHGGFITNNDH